MKARVVAITVCLSMSSILAYIPLAAQADETLLIFAASSLTDAFEELAVLFEAQTPNVDVQFNFGGSSTLAAQLAQGAPADVFASANAAQMETACEAERILSEPVVFVRNRLVVALPADNPAHITSLLDLANPGVKLVLAAQGVPVRDYTETMLERLALEPDYGEAYREAVLANLVSEEDNVRQVSAKVALGEADAGIVYQSDITPDIAESVITLPISDAYNTIAYYPIAVTTEGENPVLAGEWIRFVLSDDGQTVLERWGFVPVNEAQIAEATPEADSATAEPTPESTPEDAYPSC